ncbi:DinB family protein [Paenibacillus sp. GCM10027626]|uniref:DinB family protein n=1 Tax=Paenibacillus sp. GCM10027626 TaxID=3273411 RepID=UPI003627C5FD
MFVTIKDFIAAWNHESAATQRVLDALTDESLKQSVAPNQRTLGQIAWHIATTVHEMLARTGLEFAAPEGEESAPASAAVIADTYRQSGEAMLVALQSQWTDASLQETNDMYGAQWPKGLTLDILIKHEIHHRGQMTILMRQAGLRVPDVYGPTREQWLEWGMEPLI